MTRLANVASGDTITATIENADRAGINRTQQLMTPTSVSTGTIGTYGAVTVSGASAVSINGCFTSEYDWYQIIFDLTTSGAANLTIVLRLSGTDSIVGYDRQNLITSSATATASQGLNGASIALGGASITGRHSGTVNLWSPALAVATTGTVQTLSTPNPMTTSAATLYAGVQHRNTTAYDGFTITPTTGTITGAIRVYGII